MFENQTMLLVIIVLIIVVVVGFIVISVLMDDSESSSEAGTVTLEPAVVLMESATIASATAPVDVT